MDGSLKKLTRSPRDRGKTDKLQLIINNEKIEEPDNKTHVYTIGDVVIHEECRYSWSTSMFIKSVVRQATR